MRFRTRLSAAAFLVVLPVLPQTASNSPAKPAAAAPNREWQVYGGNPEGTRYSPLKQIDRSNVGRLTVAWTYQVPNGAGPGGLETNPIVVRGVLYANTPGGQAIALDGATGKLVWSWDSHNTAQKARGMTYWAEGADERIFAGMGRYVYALNARTGEVISSFGKDGRIDLHQDLGRDPEKESVTLTSPGIVYKDLLIVGGRESEGLPASYGDIRAYNARSGKLAWSFHTIPRPGEYGYETWPKDAWTYTGAANNWAGMAIDLKRGIVYVPTGSAAADFYGANRVGDDLFANCLLALDAATGKRIWHFQAVKHDLWDRDFPSPPVLVTVMRDGKPVDAVAQTTKQGYVYLFDRVNGKPLFPIEYRKYPASTLEGEVTAETQPLPTKPAPYARQLLTEDLLTNRTPEAHRWALERFRTFRSEGQFIPLSARQGDGGLSRFRWRRRMGRLGFRSGVRPALCKRQRSGMDRQYGVEHARGQRTRFIYSPVRGLPWHGHGRKRRPGAPAEGYQEPAHGRASHRNRAERRRPHAWLSRLTAAGVARAGAIPDHRRFRGGDGAGSALALRSQVPVHRLQEVSRSGWISGDCASVGYAQCDQFEYWRIRLEDPARRISRSGCERA